jgi:hypothetical protein
MLSRLLSQAFTRCVSERSGWFCRPDGGSHRAELGGLAPGVFGRGACEGVYELSLLDVDVAPCDQLPRVLSMQESAGNSAGPEVDALARVLGDLFVDHYVGYLQAAARA